MHFDLVLLLRNNKKSRILDVLLSDLYIVMFSLMNVSTSITRKRN